MDAILNDLLGTTAARGVWVFSRGHVIAAAVSDATAKPPPRPTAERPTNLSETEAGFDLEDSRFYTARIGEATLVVSFDDRSSLGVIRIRVRNATAALESALHN